MLTAVDNRGLRSPGFGQLNLPNDTFKTDVESQAAFKRASLFRAIFFFFHCYFFLFLIFIKSCFGSFSSTEAGIKQRVSALGNLSYSVS